jgi:mono/diheme cytochrome c family protein
LVGGFAGGVALAADEAKPPASEGAPATQAPAPSGGAAGEAQPPKSEGAPAAQAPAPSGGAAAGGGTPLETARQAEKGSLKSPYEDFASVADEGHKKFMAAGCNGCHGGTGGGGMGPPLTNQVWVYGKDNDTLFRLIALGSDELQKEGYSRNGSENVVGPMPPFGGIVKSDDDMWKIIAWIRSVNPSSSASAAN